MGLGGARKHKCRHAMAHGSCCMQLQRQHRHGGVRASHPCVVALTLQHAASTGRAQGGWHMFIPVPIAGGTRPSHARSLKPPHADSGVAACRATPPRPPSPPPLPTRLRHFFGIRLLGSAHAKLDIGACTPLHP